MVGEGQILASTANYLFDLRYAMEDQSQKNVIMWAKGWSSMFLRMSQCISTVNFQSVCSIVHDEAWLNRFMSYKYLLKQNRDHGQSLTGHGTKSQRTIQVPFYPRLSPDIIDVAELFIYLQHLIFSRKEPRRSTIYFFFWGNCH